MNISYYIKENKNFIINLILTTVLGGVISFLNYLFNVYLARNLDSSDFGLYNGAIGILYLIQIPAIAIQSVITKKVAQNKDFNLEEFKKKSLIQFILIGSILSFIFFMFRGYISDIAGIPIEYMIPLTIALFASIVSPISKGFALGLERILLFNLILLFETVLKFGMGYFSIQFNTDITIPILANCLPALLTLILVIPFIKSKKEILPKQSLKVDYKTLFLMFTTYFLINTPYTLDLVLVDPSVRASYSALSLLGKIVYFASITVASVMFARLANEEEYLRKRTLFISLTFTILTGLGISLMYFLFNDLIVHLVFKGMYLEISPYIGIYGIAMTAYATSYMIVNSFLVKGDYSSIYLLILVTLLQVFLFNINNGSIQSAFNNQIIIYFVLSIFIFILLIFKVFKNGRKEK